MTKILREIIGGREPTFSTRIQQLEDITGKRTIDIELTAEMLSKLSDITKTLNLDPHDTTPEELYAVLIQKAQQHDQLLRNSYNGNIDLLIRKINHHPNAALIPVIKQSKIRSIIGEVPPKKVMSLLGYRSISSMLKRADINQILLGCFLHESVTWHRLFAKTLKKCLPSDIIMDYPRIVVLDKKLLNRTNESMSIPYIQFAGIVGVDVSKIDNQYGWLAFIAWSTDGLFYVHQRGIYLKLNRFSSKMPRQLVSLTYLAANSVSKIASVRLPWSVIYHYVSSNLEDVRFTQDGPVEKEDFKWKGAVEILKNVHQQLDFWKSLRIIAKPTHAKPVSLNISDIAFNALYGVSYLQRSSNTIARLTLDELLSKYFKHTQDKDEKLTNIGI